jgi:hypothetical protein
MFRCVFSASSCIVRQHYHHILRCGGKVIHLLLISHMKYGGPGSGWEVGVHAKHLGLNNLNDSLWECVARKGNVAGGNLSYLKMLT